jgi:hypothetical protein
MCLISLTELTEAQAKEVWAAELAQQQRDKLQYFANRSPRQFAYYEIIATAYPGKRIAYMSTHPDGTIKQTVLTT